MSGPFVKKYLDLYHRLRALSEIDPEDPDACWLWKGVLRGRTKNYPRINVRTVEGGHRQLSAHRLSLVVREILEAGGEDWDLIWPLYHLYLVAEFEADHSTCNNPRCINDAHLVWRTKEEHLALTIERRRKRVRVCPEKKV